MGFVIQFLFRFGILVVVNILLRQTAILFSFWGIADLAVLALVSFLLV